MVIECSGHPRGFDTGIRSLRRRGTLAQTGLFVGEASVEPMLWALNDLTIVGTWCYWVYDFDRIAAQISAGDLPVEQPAKFDTLVNLRTAKTLNISIPPSILLRADDVIE